MKYVIFLLEVLASLAGLLVWNRSRPQAIRVITIMLLFTVLIECYSQFLQFMPFLKYRLLIYNLFSFVEMGCWFCFYYRIYPSKARRKVILLLGALYVIFSVVELSFYRSWLFSFHTDSYRFYSLCIIFLAVLYLWDTMMKKEYHPLNTDAVFWLSAGGLIFQSVFFIHLSIFNILSFRRDAASVQAFNLLLDIANIVYYTVICFAFYTSYRLSVKDS
jgi:hypothetical protein